MTVTLCALTFVRVKLQVPGLPLVAVTRMLTVVALVNVMVPPPEHLPVLSATL